MKKEKHEKQMGLNIGKMINKKKIKIALCIKWVATL